MTDRLKHKIVRITIVSVIFMFFGFVFFPFLTPLVMAALFAFALDPLVSRYGLGRSRRRLPTLIILSVFFVMIALPIVTISLRVVNKIRYFNLTTWQDTSVFKTIEALMVKGYGVAQKMGMNVSQDEISNPSGVIGTAGGWIVGVATGLATQAPEMILALFVFSCALFYFLTESKNIRKGFERLDLLNRGETKQIIEVIQRTSYITLVSTLIIGAVQAAIVSLGGWIAGFHEILLVFIITIVTSLIPVIGAAPIAFVMSGLCFLSSDVSGGVIMLVVGTIAGSIDNIIRPWILSSDDEDLNPIILLIAIIGAVLVYGVPGLLLGPILARLSIKIVPILFPADLKIDD